MKRVAGHMIPRQRCGRYLQVLKRVIAVCGGALDVCHRV